MAVIELVTESYTPSAPKAKKAAPAKVEAEPVEAPVDETADEVVETEAGAEAHAGSHAPLEDADAGARGLPDQGQPGLDEVTSPTSRADEPGRFEQTPRRGCWLRAASRLAPTAAGVREWPVDVAPPHAARARRQRTSAACTCRGLRRRRRLELAVGARDGVDARRGRRRAAGPAAACARGSWHLGDAARRRWSRAAARTATCRDVGRCRSWARRRRQARAVSRGLGTDGRLGGCRRAAADRSGVRRGRLPRLGPAARPAHGAGRARGGARHRAPRRGVVADRRRPHRHRRARAGSGRAPRRRRRGGRRRPRPRRGERRGRPAAPAQRRARRRPPGAPDRGRADRLRRALLGGLAPLRLPDRRPGGGGGPAAAAATCWSCRSPWTRQPWRVPRRRSWASTTSRRSAASAPGATTIRTLLELGWERQTDGLLVGTVRADAFCHNMVRALVGCLVAVGEGRRDAAWAAGVLRRTAARPGGDRRTARTGSRSRRSATPPTTSSPGRPSGRGWCGPLAEHYFSADPSVPFTRAPVRARVWGHDLALESGSGVFAQGRLDIGTSVLLRETEPPGPGRYLDLGCGYGVIGLAIAVAAGRCEGRRGRRQRASLAARHRQRGVARGG